MAGPNLRQRIGHGFVSRQALAESAAIELREAPEKKFIQSASTARAFLPLSAKASSLKIVDDNISGAKGSGFFDFMFPKLKNKPLVASDADLAALAKVMKDTGGPSNNETIPAGFTYLGQFVDHDITLDLTPLSDAQNDPEMTRISARPGWISTRFMAPAPGRTVSSSHGRRMQTAIPLIRRSC